MPDPNMMTGQDSGELDFPLPQGMELEPGEEKEMSCVVRGKGNGIGCVVSVNGEPVGEYGEQKEAPAPPEEQDMAEEGPDTESRAMGLRNKMMQRG